MSTVRVILMTLFMMGWPLLWQAISQENAPRSRHFEMEEKDFDSSVLKWIVYASATFLLGLFAFDLLTRRGKRKRLLRKRHTRHHR